MIGVKNTYLCGGETAKVYKTTNRLAINIPTEVLTALGIKDGDEVDFFRYNKASFLFAKKDDIVALITKLQERRAQAAQPAAAAPSLQVSEAELSVLKKLDTLRYSERTKDKVNAILNQNEKLVLQSLMKKKMVSLFKKPGEQEFKYGIQKSVYDMFLYKKRQQTAAPAAQKQAEPKIIARQPAQPKPKQWESKLGSNYVELLESKGFLVLNNEADAANASAALETSIRQGLVVGIRAFNKKFYIALRGFIAKNAPKITEQIAEKAMNVSEIAKRTGVEEDGVRAILHIMAEDGASVMEVREDVFRCT
ncbi:MAG: AbrB/MazE/SpoVT family DNA-binding domain-containing protein [Candidatus Micrarchaeota archaeon]|nr:AbrB/MazE/SpoVT family DNA-binding domain-containing protein [Candidatus Micrarchaeota archaeon]